MSSPFGVEELLGTLANRLGLDLRNRSLIRKLIIAGFWLALGALLLIGGVGFVANHLDDAIAIVGGALSALLGAAYLARITFNIFKN